MKEWFYRAIRTFFQAFCGTISTTIVGVISGMDFNAQNWWKYLIVNLLVPAIAAGVAAAMNVTPKHQTEIYELIKEEGE